MAGRSGWDGATGTERRRRSGGDGMAGTERRGRSGGDGGGGDEANGRDGWVEERWRATEFGGGKGGSCDAAGRERRRGGVKRRDRLPEAGRGAVVGGWGDSPGAQR